MADAASGAGIYGSAKVNFFKSRKRLTLFILAALVILAAFLVWLHFHKNHKIAASVAAPSNTQLGDNQSKAAAKAVSDRNYSAAAQEYIVAASAAEGNKDYQQAKTILQTAISKIPDDQTPYTVYDNLYSVAAAMNDKSLEVSSLNKALAKAQQPGSGAPAGLTDLYKQLLSKLGQ